MNIDDSLKEIGFPFCIEIYSDKLRYIDILVKAARYYLSDPLNQVICVTFKNAAYDISRKLKEANRLFFVDTVSIFKDYGLPYKNFNLINRPDLVDDIWYAISLELVRRKQDLSRSIIIFDDLMELSNYIGINESMMFLNPLIRQIRSKGASIILLSGINGNNFEKEIFHRLADRVIIL